MTDHVQTCQYCRRGITFVPEAITWFGTAALKNVEDAIQARVWCPKGPEGKHRPDIYAAAEAEKHRLRVMPQQEVPLEGIVNKPTRGLG